MKVKQAYALQFLTTTSVEITPPVTIEQDGMTFLLPELLPDGRSADTSVEMTVSHEALRVVEVPGEGVETFKRIAVGGSLELGRFHTNVVNLVSFLLDVPIRYSHRTQDDALIPTTPEDDAFLESLGTRALNHQIDGQFAMRSFAVGRWSGESVQRLLEKDVGLALYAQALMIQGATAQFREFWRVLESAFGAQDEELVHCLEGFRPAQDMCFTVEELRKLVVLRGRASHASSRTGMEELRQTANETSDMLPRLKNLVEQVILAKETWGAKGGGVKRVAPMSGFFETPRKIRVYVEPAAIAPDD